MARNFDFLFYTRHRFFEPEAEVITQVFTSAAPAPGATAKELAEDIAKNIFESGGEIEAASKRAPFPKRCMAVLIVSCPLLSVGENLISFGNFLEFFFSLLIARIAVRVILECQLPVDFLYLVFAGIAGNPEQLVIVFFGAQLKSASKFMFEV
jgi:hypothetical protein